jgi:pSer/pThr/pTyr-binding forkhead associated (FHA) protein
MVNGATASLVVLREDGYGDAFPLAVGQTYTLGRATSNRIVLKDDRCSREHAEIGFRAGRWRVRDLNSLNGTRVNNVRLHSEWELELYDVLYLGSTHLLFVEDMNQLPDLTGKAESSERIPRLVQLPDLTGNEESSERILWVKGGPHPISATVIWEVIQGRIEAAELHNSPVAAALQRAQELVRTDPDMGLAKCRQILENTLSELHRDTIGSPGTKRLEQLISDLARQGRLPRKVHALCEVVRELGNVGAHPIYDDEFLSHREAQISLQALVIVLEWQARAKMSATTLIPKPPSTKDGVPDASPPPDSTPTVRVTSANMTSAATPLHKDGDARFTAKYDERGNRTEWAYFGLEGRPVPHKDGFAKATAKYDERGNNTEVAYFGPDDKPVLHKDGYAKVTWTHDANRNRMDACYYDTDGKPLRTRSKIMVVVSQSQAARLGLKSGDVLVGYGGEEVKNKFRFLAHRRNERPEDNPKELRILRDDKTLTFSITPGLLGVELRDEVLPKAKKSDTENGSESQPKR